MLFAQLYASHWLHWFDACHASRILLNSHTIFAYFVWEISGFLCNCLEECFIGDQTSLQHVCICINHGIIVISEFLLMSYHWMIIKHKANKRKNTIKINLSTTCKCWGYLFRQVDLTADFIMDSDLEICEFRRNLWISHGFHQPKIHEFQACH